jgi:hypothetical protein
VGNARPSFFDHRIIAKPEHLPGILNGNLILELGTTDALDGSFDGEEGFFSRDADTYSDSVSPGKITLSIRNGGAKGAPCISRHQKLPFRFNGHDFRKPSGVPAGKHGS